VSSCQSGVYKLTKYSKIPKGESYELVFEGFNECVSSSSPSTDGRAVLGFDIMALNQEQLDIIIKCKAGYLPIVYLTHLEYTNTKYQNQPENYVDNIIEKIPSIQVCYKATSNSPQIANCEYYQYALVGG
jgi:hypothetical protein